MSENNEYNKLDYIIHKCSSYSSNYVPENITVDNPNDQSSRWSTNSITPPQFLILKLKRPSIVKTITFGKYVKNHVCNLKKFSILGGVEENTLSELFTGRLRNDSVAETFVLRQRTRDGLPLPSRYVSIVPHLSWGPAFNYTVWYVELRGQDDPNLLAYVLQTFNLRKEEEAVRICLKHMRRRRYEESFAALTRETGVWLEAPAPSRLWDAIVEAGDYDAAERIIDEAVKEGQFEWYLKWQPYSPHWSVISPCSAEVRARLGAEAEEADASAPPSPDAEACNDRSWAGAWAGPSAHKTTCTMGGAWSAEACEWCETGGARGAACRCRPGARGGHQLCVDSERGQLYLFGGWDGSRDLDDLWVYSVGARRWRRLCASARAAGGPSPRSCHKMVLHPRARTLYTLGRYIDAANRTPQRMMSEFYEYDIDSGTWSCLSEDTSAEGGPRLVFDHQMCIDPDAGVIYVFGGRVLPLPGEEAQYSGLYSYEVAARRWRLLLADGAGEPPLFARVGHSMLFHPVHRRLYIFAGQRNKEHLLDFVWLEVGTGRARAGRPPAWSHARAPPADGFTQRATLDADRDEIYVLSGLSKEKEHRVCNVLWVFSLTRRSWTCVYRNEDNASITPSVQPCPRFAHQLVYDSVNKVHYLFGGNPGKTAHPRLRLDDFWSLKLERMSTETLHNKLRIMLRKARFQELASMSRKLGVQASANALNYLQTKVHAVYDHGVPEQADEFRKLATTLFEDSESDSGPPLPMNPSRMRALRYRIRRAVEDCSTDGDMSTTTALAAVLGVDIEDNEEDTVNQARNELLEDEEMDTELEGVDAAAIDHDISDEDDTIKCDVRQKRYELFDKLAEFFPPQYVHPKDNLTDFIKL